MFVNLKRRNLKVGDIIIGADGEARIILEGTPLTSKYVTVNLVRNILLTREFDTLEDVNRVYIGSQIIKGENVELTFK